MDRKLDDYIASLNGEWKEDVALLGHLVKRLAEEIQTWRHFPHAGSDLIAVHWAEITTEVRIGLDVLRSVPPDAAMGSGLRYHLFHANPDCPRRDLHPSRARRFEGRREVLP